MKLVLNGRFFSYSVKRYKNIRMKNNPKIHTKNLIINMLKYRLYWIFTELINVMMKISG